ncbi:MAG TPA: ABC transporter permease subunit [Clostridia bacterium]|nr:ABC transporter permease subunit [Clostridia bacterium]
MTVFKREFVKNLKALIIWTVSVTALLALMLVQYKSMGSGLDSSSYTEAFKNAMGMNKLDMSTFLGYYAVKASVVVTLFGGIYAAILGSGLVVKDESLLARPISRGRIAAERLLSAMASILIFDLAVLATVVTIERDQVIYWIAAGQFLLHMVFVCVGFLAASARIRSKAPMMIPIGVVLATYVLTLIYGLSDKMEFVKYLSPFYYTDVKDIIVANGISAENVLIAGGMALLLAAAGYVVYTRRDMPA